MGGPREPYVSGTGTQGGGGALHGVGPCSQPGRTWGPA